MKAKLAANGQQKRGIWVLFSQGLLMTVITAVLTGLIMPAIQAEAAATTTTHTTTTHHALAAGVPTNIRHLEEHPTLTMTLH